MKTRVLLKVNLLVIGAGADDGLVMVIILITMICDSDDDDDGNSIGNDD